MTPSSLSPPAPRSLNTLQPLLSPAHVLLQPPPRSRTRNLPYVHTFREKEKTRQGVGRRGGGGWLAGWLTGSCHRHLHLLLRASPTHNSMAFDRSALFSPRPHHQPSQLLGRPVRTYCKRMIANAFPHCALLSLRPFVSMITCSALPSLFSIPRSLQFPLPRPASSCLISLDIRIPFYQYFLPGP